jgi:hypothetical protein
MKWRWSSFRRSGALVEAEIETRIGELIEISSATATATQMRG